MKIAFALFLSLFSACAQIGGVTGVGSITGPGSIDGLNHNIIAPSGSFAVSLTPVYTNTTITFTPTLSGNAVTSFQWQFGDGATDTAHATATHLYSSISNYTVFLYASNAGGYCVISNTVNVIQSNTWRYVWGAWLIHQPVGTAPVASNDINNATIIDPAFAVGSTLPENFNTVSNSLLLSSLQNSNVTVSLSGYSVPGAGVITEGTTNQLTQLFPPAGTPSGLVFTPVLFTMRTITLRAIIDPARTNTANFRDMIKLDLTNNNTGGNLITINCDQLSGGSNAYYIEVSAGTLGTYRTLAPIIAPSSPGAFIGIVLQADTTGANGVANLSIFNETTGQTYGYASVSLNSGNPANGIGIVDWGWGNVNAESITDMGGLSDTWRQFDVTDSLTAGGA